MYQTHELVVIIFLFFYFYILTMNCLIYVLSYKREGKWNEPLEKCIERLNELGFSFEVLEGYNYNNYQNIKKTQVCYKNFVDKFLKSAIDNKKNYDGFIYLEDDTYIINDIELFPENNIQWLAYWNKKENYTYGASMIYVPKNKLVGLYYNMKADKPIHLDYYLHKKKNEYNITIHDIPQGLEISHISMNTLKYRKHKYMLKNLKT